MKHPENYLHDSPLFMAPDVQLLGMGIHQTSPAGIIHRPLGTEGLLITVFHSEALVRLQGVEHHVPPSTVVIWEPGHRHYYGNERTGWTYSWLRCTGTWLHGQLAEAHIPTQTLLMLDHEEVCDDFLQDLRHECVSHAAPDPDIVRQFIVLWLLHLRRLLKSPQAEQTIPPEWLALKQHLDAHYADPITLGMMAEHMSLSAQHFSRLFKHYFQLTLMEYLKQVRLEQARYLLSDHNLSISEIARRTGYETYTYFSDLFSAYFGVSPRAMRKGMSGEVARQRLIKERRSAELSRWTREGWQMIRQLDYTQLTCVDADWDMYHFHDPKPTPSPASDLAEVVDGALHLGVRSVHEWTALRYRGEVSEEAKIVVQVSNTTPNGPNLAIAISGELHTGYRLRIFGYANLYFETIRHGYWEVLHHCAASLDASAVAYTVVLWRSGDTFFAEVDGERIMTHEEPFAALGPAHRTIGLGRFGLTGDARVTSVQIWVRRTPRYVDILEPGRAFLRQGHHSEALQWFRRIAEEHHEADIQNEAAYLVALATPEDAGAEKEAALQRVWGDVHNPFRPRALRALTLYRLAHLDIAGAVESVLQLEGFSPDSGLVQHCAQTIIAYLETLDSSAQQPVMLQLARLPVETLDFLSTPLTQIDALRGMRLTDLNCGPGSLVDLSPLAGMPLTAFSCNENQLTDLSPLAGMALTSCSVAYNAITDLSPLTGMPLEGCICEYNRISDLMPLAGMPLQILKCGFNKIDDLTPLTMLPLKTFFCMRNRIHDLRPLAYSPLEYLVCSGNPVHDFSSLPAATLQNLECCAMDLTDLRSLAHLSLSTLTCSNNAITDLSPLSSMPLSSLDCSENPITDLTPLTHLPLTSFRLSTFPAGKANDEVIAGLPLRELYCQWLDASDIALVEAHPTLRSVNAHERTYVARVAPTVFAAVAAWRKNPHRPVSAPFALREYATTEGERAYLSLPIILPRQEALAFCRWQGGALVSPATEEQYTALQRYLATVILATPLISHYLGLLIDEQAHQVRWQSGAPYTWHRWQQAAEAWLFQPHRGFPVFISNSTPQHYFRWWNIDDWGLSAPAYTIIEWPA